jgi:hypothetical protein
MLKARGKKKRTRQQKQEKKEMQTRNKEGKKRREKCRTLRARSFEDKFMVQQDPFPGCE